jgi:hypothetical protein
MVAVEPALSYSYDPVAGPARRIEFAPHDGDRYCRVESEWTGCRWREVGREVVRTLDV